MFYYPNVLQRHTGCFSTIWLAATKGTKIIKREYLKVNVMNTCRNIIQYILEQVPPPYQGCPIPRLSLYLSAQLSYGVVRVYHRQCDLLIEEMKDTLERLHRAGMQLKIDLLQSDQLLLIPDSLSLMQSLEHAPDPFFGIMDVPSELPDPLMIPQIRTLLETSDPEVVRLERTPARRARRSLREDSDHLTSPEAITMREEEPILLPAEEMGQELPELTALDFELLTSDLPTFPEDLPEPRKRDLPREAPPKDKDLPKKPRKEKPKEPHIEREDVTEAEVQRPDVDRDLEMERERSRQELQQKEREIERLREEQRVLEQQRQSEREHERREAEERERKLLQAVEKEMQGLRKAIRELEDLQESGAAEQLLREQQIEIERLKELQKERKRQWENEKAMQSILEEEREKERLLQREKDRERLQEAQQEIDHLRRSLAEKEEEARRTEEIRDSEMLELIDEARETLPELPSDRHSPRPSLPTEMASELDVAMQLDEVTGEQSSLFPEMVPEIQPPQFASPQLQLPELPVEAAGRPTFRRSARRSRLIIDEDIQIASKIMRERTSDPHIYTQPMAPVTLPYIRPRTAASLLESPTYEQFMAPELVSLWSQCAVLEPLQYIREREETASEPEVVRAVTESVASFMLSSEMSLEASEEDRSRPISFTPEERRTIPVQDDTLLPMVSEVPEPIVEMPQTEGVLLEDIERRLYDQIDSDGYVEFLSLTPPSRLLVSRFFYSCLELWTQKVIRMEQAEPYGRILISCGDRYSQE
ncbi:meiotic recombination protein REC8 homolog [Hyperolius riggenbachi]|uniref:meiotic recombination protein REC8 homolog n=1 Tax=Hyperolius riggenbachi TaxID=752182 RepID=UPI0035A3444A